MTTFPYPEVVAAARQAGQILMEYYLKPIAVQEKADHSPVTEADLAAQAHIQSVLARVCPEIPVISEEAPLPDYVEREHWPRFWLVDPLDGTKEFLHQNGEFTVNIALIEKGVPTLGIIYAPALEQLYVGSREVGSWRECADGQLTRLICQRKALSEPLRMVSSRSHPSAELEQWAREHHIIAQIPVGSSLKFCRVAEGVADVYVRFHSIREWDVAAGDAIYRYATLEGAHPSALHYNTTDLRTPAFIIGATEISP